MTGTTTRAMRFLSVFSGIGAHDLGFQTAGIRIVGQIEIDPFCTAVLEKHWPGLARWSDVRDVTTQSVRKRCGAIDGITGGFACTDISVAGRGAGLGRETRSGLTWRNLFRLIRGLRPRFIVIENVPALRERGYDRVAAPLERIGYTLWPVVVGAWAIGAPHRRNRVWVVGRLADDPNGGLSAGAGLRGYGESRGRRESIGTDQELADPSRNEQRRQSTGERPDRERVGLGGDELAHPASRGLRTNGSALGDAGHPDECSANLADATDARLQGQRPDTGQPQRPEPWNGLPSAWPSRPGEIQYDWEAPRLSTFSLGEPIDGPSSELVRVITGVRGCTDGEASDWWRRNRIKVERRLNREALKALGNCNPPHVPYLIGRWIIEQWRAIA